MPRHLVHDVDGNPQGADAVPQPFEDTDFFLDESLFDDPYPYYEYVREHRGPVWIDPRYDIAVVTGHEEETIVLR
jgi:hypothetical protein